MASSEVLKVATVAARPSCSVSTSVQQVDAERSTGGHVSNGLGSGGDNGGLEIEAGRSKRSDFLILAVQEVQQELIVLAHRRDRSVLALLIVDCDPSFFKQSGELIIGTHPLFR